MFIIRKNSDVTARGRTASLSGGIDPAGRGSGQHWRGNSGLVLGGRGPDGAVALGSDAEDELKDDPFAQKIIVASAPPPVQNHASMSEV
mmetsp:Transcript_4425/g.5879  ORF Transcript_4425/g.5879 Transcript_4425/m.5879 type:complete len:89 (-) Transcript_4425:153-419(-)